MKQLSNYDIDVLNDKRREPTEFTLGNASQGENPGRRVKRRTGTEVNARHLEVPIALLVTGAMLTDLHESKAREDADPLTKPSTVTTTAECVILSSDDDDVQKESAVMRDGRENSKPIITPALHQQLKFDIKHDGFSEPQHGYLCLVHAVNHVLGFVNSDHFGIKQFDDAARALGQPTSTSDEFKRWVSNDEPCMGFSDTVLFDVFHKARTAGFSVKQYRSEHWEDSVGMQNILEIWARAGVLRGLIFNTPGHFIAHRLQSTGCFAEIDSQHHHSWTYRTTRELVAHTAAWVKARHPVYVILQTESGKPASRKNATNKQTYDNISGAVNSGNLCFATTAAVVACTTLQHLGLTKVVADIGWGNDTRANTEIASQFAKDFIQADHLYNADGTLRQNDYAEVLGGILQTIPCLNRATSHNGTTEVVQTREIKCSRSKSKPISDSFMYGNEQTLCSPVQLSAKEHILSLGRRANG